MNYNDLANDNTLAQRAIKNFLLIMLAKWVVIIGINVAAKKILNEK